MDRIKIRFFAVFCTVFMGSALALAVQSPAMASWSRFCDTNYYRCQIGVRVSGIPSDVDTCTWRLGEPNTTACIKYNGDLVWVKDTAKDGHSSVTAIYRFDGKGHKYVCRNRAGAGTWVRCNFDWQEGNRWIWDIGEWDQETQTWWWVFDSGFDD